MRSLLELAATCEDGMKSDRDLEMEIWRANGGVCPPGKKPLDWLHCYTSSVNAALELCDPTECQDVMHEAIKKIGRRLNLHIASWPADVVYADVLARHVTAAALRRIDVRRREETGETIDLEYVELPDFYLRMANTYHRADAALVQSAELDIRPMARIWDAIVGLLLKDRILTSDPSNASDAMVAAGQAAYDRKNDDCWAQSPTEEPDAGGGPAGYAWRAMVKRHKVETAS